MSSSELITAKGALNEKLLANARKSLSEIAEIIGGTEAEIAEKYSVLFEDRGWMSERQEERLMLIELGQLLQDAKSKLSEASLDQYASIARVVLQSMTLMANRFDTRKKLVEEDINRLTAAQARIFGAAYDAALTHVVTGLRILHPDITDEEVNGLAMEGLKASKKVLEKSVKL